MVRAHLKIAVVLQSRFELFYFINPLLRFGHEVTLFMNYPKQAIRDFGIDPRCRLVTLPSNGIFQRFVYKLNLVFLKKWVFILFGKWAANRVLKDDYDVILVTNWVAYDLLKRAAAQHPSPLVIVNQVSAHADHVDQIYRSLESKYGCDNTMTDWSLNRQKAEYALANHMRVISKYSLRTFTDHGISSDKLLYLPSAEPAAAFKPSADTVLKRVNNIRSSPTIKVFYAGGFAAGKGIFEIMQLIDRLDPKQFHFTIAGNIGRDFDQLATAMRKRQNVNVVGRVSEAELKDFYESSHVYLFPTYVEGYAQTLAQSGMSGLLLLTTPHCQSQEYFENGAQGWIVPASDVKSMEEKLVWVHANREAAADMLIKAAEQFKPRTFEDAAIEMDACIKRLLPSG
jgi:glycosyltransferase involved in cell wall biosynthesis